MDEVFLLNEKLKEDILMNCGAKYALTTFYPKGLNSIPFIADIIGQNLTDDVPYYETNVIWHPDAKDEDLDNALNCINVYSKKINKIAVMTDVVEESHLNGIHFVWAIFLDKIENNDIELG